MKKTKFLSFFIVLVLLMVWTIPVSAQLGDSDSSSFMIQNVSGGSVTVTVQFVNESGGVLQPSQLDGLNPTQLPNPFSLANGASKQIIVSNIPVAQLPAGRYSVIISSTGQVVAVATVTGAGTSQFTGGYSSFSSGATSVYFSTVTYNFAAGWYSMISVMNLGSLPANVTVTITCANPGYTTLVGTLSRTGIPSLSSYTWALKNTLPTGFNASTTHCQGSAVVASTNGQPVAAVNNQNIPSTGRTATFETLVSGAPKVYVPQINVNFSGWDSAVNILKLGTGSTLVTVDWGDADPNDTCALDNNTPSCQLYARNFHTNGVRTSAIITSDNGKNLLVSLGSSKDLSSGGYNGIAAGSPAVALPLVMKNYLNWVTSLNCMNVSTTATTLNFAYEGYPANAYNHPTNLNEGESIQVFVPNELFLPNGYLGSAVVTANAANALISCMVGAGNPTNEAAIPGDWTQQYIGLPK